jgi:hypothetical protein
LSDNNDANDHRESEAVGVGMWTTGNVVTISSGHKGLVAIGDTTTAAGYVSVQSVGDCCGL